MGKVYTRDGRYGIDYVDHRGRRVRKVVAADKGVAQKLLGDAIKAVEKMKAGVVQADPREAKRAIAVHRDAYVSDLRRRGRDEMYLYVVRKHIEAAAEEQGWQRLSDCSARSISDYLRILADRKLVPKTVNTHRADLAAFLGWCVRQGVLEANPCDQVAKTTVKPVKKRRALSVHECRALLDAVPQKRRVVYLFLMYTGLRRGEAAALRWSHVHLDVANPHVEVSAATAKSGRRETVPLVPELAEALGRHRGKAKDGELVFDAIPPMEEFREDLAAAGIEEEDARGRQVVLHSLRHSLATMLVMSSVPMAVAQRIMRHRDVRLTAELYTDEGLLPLAAAMQALPSLTGPAGSAFQLGSAHINGAQNVPSWGHSGAQPVTVAQARPAAESA